MNSWFCSGGTGNSTPSSPAGCRGLCADIASFSREAAPGTTPSISRTRQTPIWHAQPLVDGCSQAQRKPHPEKDCTRMQLLDDHVVLITGSGSGLGLGVARHFRDEGARLALFEYDEAKVSTLRDEFGDDVLVVHGDVRSIADLTRCRDEVVGRFGRLTAVVGTQGIWDGNVRLTDIPVERVDTLLDEVFAVKV